MAHKTNKPPKFEFVAKVLGSTWAFDTIEERELALVMADIAEKNGMSVNSLHHIFPAVLRMLGEKDTNWSKIG